MVVTENGSSDWDVPLSSLLLPSAARKRRRICPQGNPPPPLNLFGKLVDDLLVEILIRLPDPRSSCRCKAVCKRWRSLLSDPSFNRRLVPHHQSRYQPASLFLPSHDPQSILSFLPVPDKARPRLRVFDCFKDLLLCGFVDCTGELERSYLLCNPFTKQWIALPLAPAIAKGVRVYHRSAAALVCQPRCSSGNHKLGDEAEAEPEPAFVYSEYHRFRVVCLVQRRLHQIMLVFCSESGKWEHWWIPNTLKLPPVNALSWNGKLFWVQFQVDSRSTNLVTLNPFRLHVPPDLMRLPPVLLTALSNGLRGNISVSQGAFHIIVFQVEGSRKSVSVWRREKHGEYWYWTQLYDMVLKMASPSLWGDYVLKKYFVLDLHPEKPEVVFFQYLDPPHYIVSCNLRTGTGEPEFFSTASPTLFRPCWRALQPRVSCWPTPIPRYEELRGMYNGSYDGWVQNSSTATLASRTEECQPSAEQSGRTRKNKRSAAAASLSKPCARRKQKAGVI